MPPDSDLSRSPLAYLPLEPPAEGQIAHVAEGVHWIRFPLPMELDHINLWLLEHDGGCVLIDTGLAAMPAARRGSVSRTPCCASGRCG